MQDFTWRLIFYVNVPIGIITVVSAYLFLVERPKRGGLHLDIAGLLTATPAVVALMYGVDVSTTLGWGSALVLSLSAGFVLFITSFVAAQLNHRRIAGNIALVSAVAALVMALIRGPEVGWMTVDALSMLGFALFGLAVFGLLAAVKSSNPYSTSSCSKTARLKLR